MNDTIKTIQSRRSTRKFCNEALADTELETILEAGQYAPSAKNEQPWHFTVIKSKDLLSLLNEACKSFFIKSKNEIFEQRVKGTDVKKFDLFYNAPVIIVVSGDKRAIEPQIDCALAIENMFLAAESLQIGSCWIQALNYLYETQEGKDLLVREKIIIPGYEIIGTVAFGYKLDIPINNIPRRTDTITYLL